MKMSWLKKIFKTSQTSDKKTICLDFDGVLHSYQSGWTGEEPTDPPVNGSIEFVKHLLNAGYGIVIYSARANAPQGIMGIKKWLKENQFPDIKISLEKPHAELYIDDRGYRFNGNFQEALDFITTENSLRPWNKT